MINDNPLQSGNQAFLDENYATAVEVRCMYTHRTGGFLSCYLPLPWILKKYQHPGRLVLGSHAEFLEW